MSPRCAAAAPRGPRSPRPRVQAALLLAAALAACDHAAALPDGGAPKVDFALGTLTFHVSSGVAVTAAGSLAFYLTDQADTCAAIKYTPTLPVTSLKLVIAPPADGTTQARLTTKSVPAAGEAVGSFAVTLRSTRTAGLTPTDGSVAWTAYTDGSGRVAITALDVGFAETSDRLTTAGLVVQACVP